MSQLRTPYSAAVKTEFSQVAVLGKVALSILALHCVWGWKHGRVAMPVIAIKLDNDRDRRQQRIHYEMTSYRRLFLVLDAKFIKERIPQLLDRRFPPVLQRTTLRAAAPLAFLRGVECLSALGARPVVACPRGTVRTCASAIRTAPLDVRRDSPKLLAALPAHNALHFAV